MNTSANSNISQPDKKLSAVCGLFCPACFAYIGTHEDRSLLEERAKKLDIPVEELECDGCRSDRRTFFCRIMCKMVPCAKEKGVEFCGSCPDYPCEEIRNFQKAMPNRIELWQSHQRIKEAGFETWYEEKLKHYACPGCGVMNSATDLLCRKCGNDPGSKYAELHKEEIMVHLERLRNDNTLAEILKKHKKDHSG
ncbi:MAG: DUF3795 domain-containing protein [Firmicutes bacterium]|nr:DUF3795 domain-containing protein [Bacillota bacterium]